MPDKARLPLRCVFVYRCVDSGRRCLNNAGNQPLRRLLIELSSSSPTPLAIYARKNGKDGKRMSVDELQKRVRLLMTLMTTLEISMA